ncbi:MAG: GNAT family N-acetyltransferase [Actinomycetota bacterium]|nr:GNAT family N-acetyltransferase [Actinomycetota bacterium]
MTVTAPQHRTSLWATSTTARAHPSIRTVRGVADLDAAVALVGPGLADAAATYDAPRGRLLVARVEGRVVGVAGVRRLGADPRRPDGHVALIGHLVVAHGHRGRGVGTGLLGRAMAGGYWLGCDTLRVLVGPAERLVDAARVSSFLERSGFRVADEDGDLVAERPVAPGSSDRVA